MKLNNNYLLKINSPGNLIIVNKNREVFEPAPDIIDYYWVQMQNYSEIEGQLLFTATGETANTEPTNPTESDNIGFPTATLKPESVYVDNFVNSLNLKQQAAFNVVTDWARKKVKYSNSATPKNNEPLGLFITGGAGVGKSRLIETCYAFLTKTLNSYNSYTKFIICFPRKSKSSFISTNWSLCY